MILKKLPNAHGYNDIKLMANDMADLILSCEYEAGEKHFIEWLRFKEVEEILRVLHQRTSGKHFWAHPNKRRTNGKKQNGYNFWWQPLHVPRFEA